MTSSVRGLVSESAPYWLRAERSRPRHRQARDWRKPFGHAVERGVRPRGACLPSCLTRTRLGSANHCGVQRCHGHFNGVPATGETLKTFEPYDEAEIERRLALADSAFRSYRRTSFDERAELVRAMADVFETDQRRLPR